MNYLKAYCNLIRKAEKRGYTKKKAKEQGLYVEGHHTFPVSIFGKNKIIVYLTAREHYIAHALLEKICIRRYGLNHWKTAKMIYAFWCLNNQKTKNTYLNSRLYERSKLNFSLVHSKRMHRNTLSEEHKRKIGNANRGKIRTYEQRERISKSKQKNLDKKGKKERKGLQKGTLKILNEDFKNQFIEAVNSSKTKKEIIRKLGKNPKSGSSSSLIDKWAKILNLSLDHLIGSSINKGRIASEEVRKKMSLSQRNKVLAEEHKKKIKLSSCNYVYIFTSPEGVNTETVFCSDFCLANNLDACKIREVSRGKRSDHKGWKVSRRPRTNEDK